MDTTLFLAQLWGPAILAVGIGIFVSRSYYIRIYRDLEKEALAVLVFGMVMMIAGIAQIMYHNVWDTLPQIIISIIGWGTLVKGTVFIVAPRIVDKTGDGWVKTGLIPLAGACTVIIGAYLSWFAYLA